MPVVRYQRRRLGFGRIGCGPMLIAGPILLALVAGIGGVAVAVCTVVAPGEGPLGGLFNDLAGVETRDLPGDAEFFDPIDALPEVQAYAGEGAQLVEIEMRLIRIDGTMDLEADYSPQPDTEYTFVREVARPSDAPPPGAGGANTGPWFETIEVRAYEPGQRRRRTTTGGGTNTSVTYVNKGLERTVSDPESGEVETVGAPICSVTEMFAEAVERGAPDDAVAYVTYNAEGYEFRISGVGIFLEFDRHCALRE